MDTNLFQRSKMFTFLGKKIMRHQNRFLALLIVKSIFLLVIFNKLENLWAYAKFGSDSPIKVIPTQTWKEVGNVFLKRSLWKENENSDNSEIKGCTTPKVNNMYILNCSDGLSWNFIEHNVELFSLYGAVNKTAQNTFNIRWRRLPVALGL